jgi:hypothetical protein
MPTIRGGRQCQLGVPLLFAFEVYPDRLEVFEHAGVVAIGASPNLP